MKRGLVLIAALLLGSLADAEGTGGREKLPSGADRIHGALFLTKMSNGGLLSLGGSSVRMLTPGARTWQTLYTVPNRSLYRVVSNDAGAILAAWESVPELLYFAPGTRTPVTIKQPQLPSSVVSSFGLQFLAFHPDGQSALVRMEGEVRHDTGGWRGSRRQYFLYRVPLDAKTEPELLYTVDGGQLVHQSQHSAIYLMPVKLGPTCTTHDFCDMASIVAYEVGDQGVTRRTLLTNEKVKLSNFIRRVSGSDDDRVVLAVKLPKKERGLLWWRRGDTTGDFRPFAPGDEDSDVLFVTKTDEVLQLIKREDDLEVHRFPPGGAPTVMTLHAPENPIDTEVHGVGLRSNGTLFMHWGDQLMLLPPGKPPRAYDLSPLLSRRTEWGGADLYVDKPEALWISIEVGAGRDFVKVPFAEVEKKAKVWPHD